MKNVPRFIFACALVLLTFAAGTRQVRAELLLDMNYAPSVLGTGAMEGWSSSVVADSEEKGDYLLFPSSEVFADGSGTLEMRLLRRNARPIETLFTLVNEAGTPLVIAQVHWEGTFRKGLPELNFEGVASDRLWSWDWSAPRFGSSKVVSSTIPLGSSIEPEGELHLALTWGADGSDCAVHLNGRTLPVLVPTPFGMADLVRRSARLMVGAEPAGPGGGGFDHLNSPLLFIRIHDRAVNPFVPHIDTVTHDAFEAAGYSGRLVPGDSLTVTLVGDAYQTASFDLGPRKGLPMEEVPNSPGRYVGSYLFRWGDGFFEGPVTGHLTGVTGGEAVPSVSARPVNIDCRALLDVVAKEELLPADRSSTSEVRIRVTDANGKAAAGHPLRLTLSSTDEYTGVVGGGNFGRDVGGTIEADWGGMTDSFGEVTAEYLTGFAAKTILVSARDMLTGDVGVGWVRSFIEGQVDIVVTEPAVTRLSVAGSMDVSLSRQWLTADGQSRSRITAVVKDARGAPLSGHSVRFTLLGDNGTVRAIQSRTDSMGRAFADYIAGTVMGQVQVEVRDQVTGIATLLSIELRPDAPAQIELTAEPGEIVTGEQSTVMAWVTDANGNPNRNVDVIYDIVAGNGELSSTSVGTDHKGKASVRYTAVGKAGLVKVRGTVMSRIPTPEELSAAEGAVFLFGLDEDPGRLEVVQWLVRAGEEVAEGQDIVVLEDRSGSRYMVRAPREGTVATFAAEERDRVEYGNTLGYVLEESE